MTVTAGIDAGSSAVKAVVLEKDGETFSVRSHVVARIRKRDVGRVVRETFDAACESAGVADLHYVATTGEGEETPFATGHFFGMTTHARGALYLEPRARAVLDLGALHARAMAVDPSGRVLNSKMTSQCASGSGQFLENIARYLGVSLSEVGGLSLSAGRGENVSSICAVLAETDVINMVSRGVPTAEILRGIHESMAGRLARLLQTLAVSGLVFVTGGLAADDNFAPPFAIDLHGNGDGVAVHQTGIGFGPRGPDHEPGMTQRRPAGFRQMRHHRRGEPRQHFQRLPARPAARRC